MGIILGLICIALILKLVNYAMATVIVVSHDLKSATRSARTPRSTSPRPTPPTAAPRLTPSRTQTPPAASRQDTWCVANAKSQTVHRLAFEATAKSGLPVYATYCGVMGTLAPANGLDTTPGVTKLVVVAESERHEATRCRRCAAAKPMRMRRIA